MTYILNSVLNDKSLTNSFEPSMSNVIVEEGSEDKTNDYLKSPHTSKKQ